MQRLVLPNWTAITIGPGIFAWRELDEFELAHELAHVAQWRRHGLGFIRRYFAASSAAKKAGGDRYFDNAYEREAKAAEEQLRLERERRGTPMAEQPT
jgi:hypothetical protein